MHYLNNKEFQCKEIMAEAKVPIKHIRLEKLERTTEFRCILQQKHSRISSDSLDAIITWTSAGSTLAASSVAECFPLAY